MNQVEEVLWGLRDEFDLKSVYSYFEENHAVTVINFNTEGYHDE